MRVRRLAQVSTEIPQASLADIAFLLLVFFLAATSLGLDLGIPLQLAGHLGPRVQVRPSQVAVVQARASGQVLLDGHPLALAQVETELRARLLAEPNLIVSLETDAEAPYERMIQLLDCVQRSSAQRISLHARHGRGNE